MTNPSTTRIGRPAIHAFVEQPTHDAWIQASIDAGVSLTALLEAIGRNLPDLQADALVPWAQVTRTARQVDAQRRLRRR